jgi:putative pyruvate formate lyase activating enzyme
MTTGETHAHLHAEGGKIEPGYTALLRSGELERRVERLRERLRACDLCPRHCRINRLGGDLGYCRIASGAAVSAVTVHQGEEPCLSGSRGCGNIFFSSCNLRCVYCQNFQISQSQRGGTAEAPRTWMTAEELAGHMIALQQKGCHGINFVSPSHMVPQMAEGILAAARRGLNLPIIYNTNAYDDLETLRLLDGIVDIYLPDLKYGDEATARSYSDAPNYPAIARAAIREMHRQVADLVLDAEGIARRGIIIRHLVLPNDLADTELSLRWIAETLGTRVAISLMAQYYPTHRAAEHDLLARPLRPREYEKAIALCERLGFENALVQDLHAAPEHYRPDFTRTSPFD